MNKFYTYVIACCTSLLFSLTVNAQWNINPRQNTPVCTNKSGQFSVQAVSDNKGGTLLVWQDLRAGNYDIYAQYLDVKGKAKWAVDGIPVCDFAGNQTEPKVIPSEDAGFIICWSDDRSVNADIFIQKINEAGVLQWRNAGVPVCRQSSGQFDVGITTDGNGGAILSWTDNRNSILFNDLFIQRISANGEPAWQVNGVPACLATNNQFVPRIVSDNSGGAYLAWIDRRNGNNQPDDIYAQRFNANGTALWAENGALICAASQIPFEPRMIADGAGNAVYVWQDSRNINSDIYAQKILPNGNIAWAAAGVAVCNNNADQTLPVISGDAVNGFVIAWEDLRNSVNKKDIYAQKINVNGNAVWAANGIAVSNTPKDQLTPVVSTDNNGGAFIAWADKRNGKEDLYVVYVNTSGIVLPNQHVSVSVAGNEQLLPVITKTFRGRAALTWWDYRNGDDVNIYAAPMSNKRSDLPAMQVMPTSVYTAIE